MASERRWVSFELHEVPVTAEAAALLDALNDFVSGCKCSDERALCLACLEHCASKVKEACRGE